LIIRVTPKLHILKTKPIR